MPPAAESRRHHGRSRDDQFRWLAEVWHAAADLRRKGVPVEAVTVWSLFGAVDWNTLLVARTGHYEPGAFDIRAPQPRLTALGRATRELAATGRFQHPVLAVPGWWRGESRFYAPEPAEAGPADVPGIPVLQDGAGYAEATSQRNSHHPVATPPGTALRSTRPASRRLRNRGWRTRSMRHPGPFQSRKRTYDSVEPKVR